MFRLPQGRANDCSPPITSLSFAAVGAPNLGGSTLRRLILQMQDGVELDAPLSLGSPYSSMAEKITLATPTVKLASSVRGWVATSAVSTAASLDSGHIIRAIPDEQTMGYPARGCAYWQREPGADDE